MRTARPYQKKIINEVLGCLQRRLDPLAVSPTGSGKTVIFGNVTGFVVQHAGWHVGAFVHRRELLQQASDDLTTAGIDHGVIKPGHTVTSHKVHVASIDTVLSRLSAGCLETARWLAGLDLAIFDEAHHAVAQSWLRLTKAMAKALLFGVTATPYRLDGRGLGDVFSAAVQGPSIAELIDDGWLAPFAVYAPPTPLNMTGIGKLGGDYKKSDLQRVMDQTDLIRLGARWYSRLCPRVPAIWFGTGIDHAFHASDIYGRLKWETTWVDGGVSDDDRDAAIKGLARGTIHVLMNAELISEGVNVPVVSAIIQDRPTASTALAQQQWGRASRPIWPDGFDPNPATADERKVAIARSSKPWAWIIDMVGNVASHGMPDEPRPWSLTDGIRGMERNVRATRRCPHCYRVHAWDHVCHGCGRRYPNAPRPVAGQELWRQPGAMGLTAEQIKAMSHKDLMPLVRCATDLGSIARIKGYPRTWARQAANDPRIIEQIAGGAA